MESIGQGWQSLSNISTFMQHVEKRRQLKVFGELDARLDFCEYLIRKQSNKNDIKRYKSKKRKKQLNQDFVNAIESLSLEQLIHHFNKLVEQLVDLTLNILSPPIIESRNFIICEAYSRTYSLKMWKKKKLRFDRENHIIYAEKDKKIKIYHLANYLVRRTEKGDYFCLALEAVNNVPLQRSKSALFGFQYKNTYILWLTSIQKSVEYKHWESLVVSLNKEQLMAKKRMEEEGKAKGKQWDRLNKTQGNYNENEENLMLAAQSAIYIPLPSTNQEINLTADTALKDRHQNSPQKGENILTTSFKDEPQLDLHAILKQSYAYQLTHLSNVFQSIEDLQFQLQVQDESLKKSKMQLSFSSALLDQININSAIVEDYTHYEKIDPTLSQEQMQESSKLSVFHNKNQTNKFKIHYFTTLKPNISIKTVVSHFLNLDCYKQINTSISNCSTKTIIFSQNCTLNYQQHHPFNRLYRGRQFYYIRHLTKNTNNQYVIIDRSLKNDALPLPDNSFYVRGELNAIYRFMSVQTGVKILIDISLNNGGGLAQGQNITLSKKYINELSKGLSIYLSQNIKQSLPPKYYSFETHSKHVDKVNQTYSDRSIMLNYQTQAQVQPLLRENNHIFKANGSFYRIPRNKIIQNTSLSQSFFIDQEAQLRLRETCPPSRKTCSPSRKTYIQNRNSKKISLLNTTEEQTEFQVVLQPTWKEDWIIDDIKGGVMMKKNPGVEERWVMNKIIETAVKKSLLGKDMDNISFPVDILAPQSHLQRLMRHLRCAPSLFNGVAHLSLMQKFMKVVIFGLQISLLSLHNERAFDALLGETFQCKIGEQCNGYAEQLSVSPNVTAVYLIGKDVRLSAVLRQRFKMTMNSATWRNDGTFKVTICDQQFCFTTPAVTLIGTTYNQREFLLQQRAYYWMERENIVLQLNFQPKNSFSLMEDAKRDYFDGYVYDVTPSFMKEFIINKQHPQQQHISRTVCKVSGRWTKDITFQAQSIDLTRLPLSEIYLQNCPIPSDSSLRPDINKMREGELQEAQSLKDSVQESQAKDVFLRRRSIPS